MDEKKKPRLLPSKKDLLTIGGILLGISLQAVAITFFYEHAKIVTAGFTGIAMLIEYGMGIPNWLMLIALNLPLLTLAYFKLNSRFALSTLFVIVLLSGLMALVKTTALREIKLFGDPEADPLAKLIYALFGGIVMGTGAAIVIRSGASTGGTEVISVMLNRKFSFSVGSISLPINIAIVLAQWVFFGDAMAAAISAIALFISTISFNNVLQGLNRTKTIFIISEHWEEIAPQVFEQVKRGVTLIPCEGAYSHRKKTMVYILARTMELARIRKIVQDNDPAAIVSIVDTREVLGRGFAALKQ
ncbi:MAG: YitT family protein [Clostridiales bacterium]|nr:YitT family protein [Clostridiales bacterium]